MDLAGIDLEKLANAIVIIVTGIAVGLGFRSGKKAPPAHVAAVGGSTVELAGALVDSTSVKALAGSVEGHSLALTETRATARDFAAALDRHTEALEESTRAIVDLKEQMQEMRYALGRKG